MPVLPAMTFYRRHMPHWQPGDAALFVTWRLHGSLPASVAQQKTAEASQGRIFRFFDRHLDAAATGPLWLKEPRIAQCVVDALRLGESRLELYKLVAYVVLANHVHILFNPRVPLPKITRAIKGFTARKANAILGRTGQPFWQDESFDHWVRNDGEFRRIIRYIENNPVVAGLVQKPEDWPWSSAVKQDRHSWLSD